MILCLGGEANAVKRGKCLQTVLLKHKNIRKNKITILVWYRFFSNFLFGKCLDHSGKFEYSRLDSWVIFCWVQCLKFLAAPRDGEASAQNE